MTTINPILEVLSPILALVIVPFIVFIAVKNGFTVGANNSTNKH